MFRKRSLQRYLSLTLVLLVVVTVITPSARADEITATVFDTPDVRYANIRNGPGLEYDEIGQLNAGETVTLECFDYTYGDDVKGPYSTSRIFYKIKGYDNGWVSDAYLSTGSDDPVTAQCDIPWPVSGLELIADPGQMHWELMYHYWGNSGQAVKLPWSFFGAPGGDFARKAYTFPVGQTWTYQSSESINGQEVYYSVGKFNVVRTSPNCFRMWDTYDYDWGSFVKATLNIASFTGLAKEFNIYSSGCYPPGSDAL